MRDGTTGSTVTPLATGNNHVSTEYEVDQEQEGEEGDAGEKEEDLDGEEDA